MTQEQWIDHHNMMGWCYWIASAVFGGVNFALNSILVYLIVAWQIGSAMKFWREYRRLLVQYRKEKGYASPDNRSK